jgi:integrase
MLRLRWTHERQPYQLALGLPDSPLNYQRAVALAATIQGDIAREQFDPTLERYRPQPEPEAPPPQATTAELFERFMAYRRSEGTSGQTITAGYQPLLSHLSRWGKNITTEAEATAFVEHLRSRQSPTVANQNLSRLRGFGRWTTKQGHLANNPWADIPRLKTARQPNPKRQPLTAAQIRTVLDAAKADRYAAPYHDFVMTLFYLGVRPSEAVGLRWRHIDLERGQVTISESLARGPDGKTAGWARQRKGTKTNKARTITLHPDMVAMLTNRRPDNAKPDNLVFLSPRGNPINDSNFSQRIWKRICALAGIDRVPYSARHSLGSHLLEQGASIPQVAATLGNTPETTARHYAHMIDRPEMPGF